MLKVFQLGALLLASISPLAMAAEQSVLVLTTEDRLSRHHEQFLDSRRESLIARGDLFRGPSIAQIIDEYPAPWKESSYKWHRQISTTVFWVGELPTKNNPTPNIASAWNQTWMQSFGGLDHPDRRSGYLPSGFVPNENPFYFALPYNDIDANGGHRPEASEVIPWFSRDFIGPSISVCHNRWIAIHHKDRVCYAQWKDVGPFKTDDWKYVFQGQKPQPNRNSNAGLDVSPAIRDFLGIRSADRVSWRFVEEGEVGNGPWLNWQEPSYVSGELPTP
jgi:hypothetical protein